MDEDKEYNAEKQYNLKNKIYEVQPGDTLSEISLETDIPLDRIIEMNEMLEDENSTIRVGDELIITIPEPELSVLHLFWM